MSRVGRGFRHGAASGGPVSDEHAVCSIRPDVGVAWSLRAGCDEHDRAIPPGANVLSSAIPGGAAPTRFLR